MRQNRSYLSNNKGMEGMHSACSMYKKNEIIFVSI